VLIVGGHLIALFVYGKGSSQREKTEIEARANSALNYLTISKSIHLVRHRFRQVLVCRLRLPEESIGVKAGKEKPDDLQTLKRTSVNRKSLYQIPVARLRGNCLMTSRRLFTL